MKLRNGETLSLCDSAYGEKCKEAVLYIYHSEHTFSCVGVGRIYAGVLSFMLNPKIVATPHKTRHGWTKQFPSALIVNTKS